MQAREQNRQRILTPYVTYDSAHSASSVSRCAGAPVSQSS
jgi:hypothetical protein